MNANRHSGTGTDVAKGKTARTVGIMRWLLPLLFFSLLVVAWLAGWLDRFTLSEFIRHERHLHDAVMENYMRSALSFIALYVLLVSISFPGATFLTIAGGLLFGGLFGAIYSVIGATLGAVVVFLLARSAIGGFLEARAGPFLQRLMKGFRDDAFNYLLFLRLAPVFPFWVINIVPALMNMRLMPYAVATFAGILPGGLAYAYVGEGLVSVIAAQEAASPGCAQQGTCSIDTGALFTPTLLVALGALAFISILPVIIKKLRKDKLPPMMAMSNRQDTNDD